MATTPPAAAGISSAPIDHDPAVNIFADRSDMGTSKSGKDAHPSPASVALIPA